MSRPERAAQRRRSRLLAAGSLPMAAAMVLATAATAHATQPSGPQHKTLADSKPAWATAAADRGAAPASKTIATRVYLTGQDPVALAAAARAVADPSSPQYRQYLTPAQIKDAFGATSGQVAAVTGWLTGSGLSVAKVSNDWIDVTGSIAAVQKAFGTQINDYALPDGSLHYAPASAAQLPIDFAASVSGVSGLADAPTKMTVDSKKKTIDDSAQAGTGPVKGAGGSAKVRQNDVVNSGTPICSDYWGQHTTTQFPGGELPVDTCAYTPKQLRDAYGVTASGLTGQGATIAVIDWWASPTMRQDADRYAVAHGDAPFRAGQYTEVVDQSAWQHTDSNAADGCTDASGEEALDIDMAHGLAPDANIVYVGANSCYDADLMAAEASVVDDHTADIVSNSWGGLLHGKSGDEDPSVTAAYDRIFQKGTLEGIGFTFSSGDCGDEDPANDGANCSTDSKAKQVEWPASSQWVTAVGGTTLATRQQGDYAWEVPMGDNVSTALPGDQAWTPLKGSFFGGGGGTSQDVPQPWYQATAVPTALSTTLMDGSKAAVPMRTVPDVAMNGSLATSVAVGMTDGSGQYSEGGYGGTSVAAPEFAAIQADAIQAGGGAAIGFANPEIYRLAGGAAFNDVTQSTKETVYEYNGSKGFGGAKYLVGQDSSLKAATGYDLATGVGSPTTAFLTGATAQPHPATTGPAVHRTGGQDRFDTGIAVSRKAFPTAGSAPAVVLATGDNFPDALSGVPLAKKLGAPLLLTPTATPDQAVTDEIHRVLGPGGKVYVLGGTGAVSDTVVAALGLPSPQIQRLGGADRFATSLQIANALGNPSRVVLATGLNFPDALSAGPYAADVFGSGTPAAILLTEDSTLPEGVRQYVARASAVAAVGGQAVTAANSAPNVTERFRGIDRFDTAAQVASKFTGEKSAGVATGTQFADALTGAAYLANLGGPLVLADRPTLPDSTVTALQAIKPSLGQTGSVEIFGLSGAVTDAVENQIVAIVGGHVAG